MGSKYDYGFKQDAVRLLAKLKNEGSFVKAGVSINNVRDLVRYLDISSQTLYRWELMFNEKEETTQKANPKKKQKASKKAQTEDFFADVGELIDEVPKDEKMVMILDNTFFMAMARGLGIKNYRRPQKQLWNAVGLELIKRAGLTQTKVKKELKIKEEDDDDW